MKKSDSLTGVLEKIGLTTHESQVYLAALSLGPSRVLALSRAAGVKRTTVYSVIESLKAKGLVCEEHRGLKTIFVATHPDKLKEVLDERKRVLEKHLGELTTLYSLQGTEGTLRYYEGLEAVKSVYENILAEVGPNDFYLVVADLDRWYQLDRIFYERFRDRRAKLGIKTRLIFTNSERAQEAKQYAKNFGQEVRIMPPSTGLTPSLIVTPQRIVIHQYDPVAAIVIQAKSAIQLQKELFEIIWKALPE